MVSSTVAKAQPPGLDADQAGLLKVQVLAYSHKEGCSSRVGQMRKCQKVQVTQNAANIIDMLAAAVCARVCACAAKMSVREKIVPVGHIPAHSRASACAHAEILQGNSTHVHGWRAVHAPHHHQPRQANHLGYARQPSHHDPPFHMNLTGLKRFSPSDSCHEMQMLLDMQPKYSLVSLTAYSIYKQRFLPAKHCAALSSPASQ